jgi:hypothetical protein
MAVLMKFLLDCITVQLGGISAISQADLEGNDMG